MRASAGLRVYPDPAEVFVADQQELIRHVHPLVSIDLSLVDDEWQGWIHLVSPLEPHECRLGEATSEFHSPLQREDWLGFKLEGDRYRLTGDLRYFARATTPEEVSPGWPMFREQLDAHCEAEERSYWERRAEYQRTGELIRRFDSGDRHGPVPVLCQLGGRAQEGNWHWTGEENPHLPIVDDDEGIWPISPSGNRFCFVAEVPGYHYRRSGADGILLFYEPVEKLALIIHDWT